MRLLVLGGTVFLGRHLVEAALDREHEVTIFTRGEHHPDLFPELERLRGDRDGALDGLRGRSWDAVVDTSGYVPRIVRDSATLLADAVRRYVFISTISVYGEVRTPGIDERTPVAAVSDPENEDYGGARYGPLKALCEQAAEAAMPGRVVNVRAGLLVGPYDPSGRFTYWPRRMARGGAVLCPGSPERQVQLIDARDLADWCVRMAESDGAGTFNATGPDYRLTMGRLVETCRRAANADAQPLWLDDAFLLEQGVGPWMELPLWLPEAGGGHNMLSVNCDAALAAGLACRPLAETAAETLAWDAARPAGEHDPAGMAPEREAAVLRAWREAHAEVER